MQTASKKPSLPSEDKRWLIVTGTMRCTGLPAKPSSRLCTPCSNISATSTKHRCDLSPFRCACCALASSLSFVGKPPSYCKTPGCNSIPARSQAARIILLLKPCCCWLTNFTGKVQREPIASPSSAIRLNRTRLFPHRSAMPFPVVPTESSIYCPESLSKDD